MKRILLLFSILLFVSCGVRKVPLNELSSLKPVTLYETTDAFLNKRPMNVEAGILLKEQSDQHITVKGIFDRRTGEKIDRGLSAWALDYNDKSYFNLGYSTDVNHWKSYAKFDIEGKYSIIVIDDNSPHVLKSTSNSYGGGLTGVLIAESLKWGKNWKDRNGVKKRILFIDSEDISPKMLDRNRSSHGNYMTRKQFQKILDEAGIELSEERIKDVEFEKILEIIHIANGNTGGEETAAK